ncbi:hypothetical protein ASD25_14795 [Brevundimonas sp. Root1423]|nr:hypothetical protein ASD25_14795 [Brevundimonas sp. Root1423]KRA22797.1 hypothetical protein ASD59_09200 [Brevundimonas sp. Root608]
MLRWRFREPGKPQSQTREAFQSAAWWAWYDAAVQSSALPIGAGRVKPGSVNALAVAFYGSAEWAQLRDTTKTTYRGIIERFRVKHGDKSVATIEAHHIRGMLDAKAATPAAANNLLKVLRALMRFAVERNWRSDDPSRAVKPLRNQTDGFHTWSEEDIAAFHARWPLGTRERLAVDLLLYTAQRSGDVRVMGRQNVKGGVIRVRQEKTREQIEIPVHPALQRSLDAATLGQLTFVVTGGGEPFTAKGFGNWISAAAKTAGLPAGASAHGLRKAAARRLAEAGCTAHEIMAVTGHRTLKEVERYTQAAARKGLAESAMARIDGTEPEQKLSNPEDGLDKSRAK